MALTQTSRLELELRRLFKNSGSDFDTYAALCALVWDSAEQVLPPAHYRAWQARLEVYEEQYASGGPPMTPLTDSYSVLSSVLDLKVDGFDTIVSQFIRALKREPASPVLRKAGKLLDHLRRSRMGIYQQIGSWKSSLVVLRELVSGKEFRCQSVTGYRGAPGTLWFVRLVKAKSGKYLTLTTPYILLGVDAESWEAALQAELGERGMEVLFKSGHSRLCWHEFIFQAYCGHQQAAVFLTGLLDDPGSRPHSEGRGLAPVAGPASIPSIERALSQGQRRPLSESYPRATTSGDYLLRIDLMDTREEVYRCVRVPMGFSFAELHEVIQAAMDWDEAHSYEFLLEGLEVYQEELLEEVLGDRPELLVYRYDFEAEWNLKLSVLRDYDDSQGFASLVSAVGPAPPETCGGVIDFQRLLRALREPKTGDPNNFRDRVDADFDPWGCDLERISGRLNPRPWPSQSRA